MKIALMCFSTARFVSTSDSAIAELLLPCAISASTSRSRVVSSASGELFALGSGAHERFDDLGVDHRAASRHLLDGRSELSPVVDALLQQVGAAFRAGFEQRQRIRWIVVLAQHDHTHLGPTSHAARPQHECPRPSPWAASGCRSRRHRDALIDRREQGVQVDARRDDLHPGRPVEHLLEALPHDVAVLCQHYPDRHAPSIVPHPGPLRACKRDRSQQGVLAFPNRGAGSLERSRDRWESRPSRQGVYGRRSGRARKEQQVRGAGRAVFAAILLMIVGTVNIIYGIGALDDARHLRQRHEVHTRRPQHHGLGPDHPRGGPAHRELFAAGGQYLRPGDRDHRRHPRRARRPVFDRRGQPVVVARRVRPVRVDRVRHHRLRRGREGGPSVDARM